MLGWGESLSALDVGEVDIGPESVGLEVEEEEDIKVAEVVEEEGEGEMHLILRVGVVDTEEIEDMKEVMEKIIAGITMVEGL